MSSDRPTMKPPPWKYIIVGKFGVAPSERKTSRRIGPSGDVAKFWVTTTFGNSSSADGGRRFGSIGSS